MDQSHKNRRVIGRTSDDALGGECPNFFFWDGSEHIVCSSSGERHIMPPAIKNGPLRPCSLVIVHS